MRTFLDTFVTLQEIQNFMRIFDKNQDDDLSYQEFCDAFLPIDTFYANDLAHKTP